MKKEGVSKLDFLFTPSNDKYVYSFFDEITDGFDIDLIKEGEYGLVKLEDDISVECRKDFAFIECKDVTALVIFREKYDISLLPEKYASADFFIVSKDSDVDTDNTVRAGENTLYLEVEQNGRTRFKTAD